MSRGFIRQSRPGAHNELAYVGPVASIRDSIDVQRILDMIQELVGNPPTSEPPSYLNVAKLPPPKTYEGKDDPDQFEVWLRGLLEYFSTLHLTGPDWDRDRLRLISQSLGGKAATWFYNTVQSPSRDKWDWLFEEAIVGLYRRFVHRDTHLQAEQQFANLRFDAQRGGVAALYERMLYLSDKMWERPSDFVMRKKFLEALPDQYEQILTVYKGMSAQFNTLLELYQAASGLEQNLRASQLRKRTREAGSGSVAPHVSNTRRLVDNKSSSARDSGGARTAPKRAFAAGTSGRTGNKFVPRSNEECADRAHPSNAQGSGSKPGPGPSRGPICPDKVSVVRCYACGQIGHYSTDPKCPQYGKKADKPTQCMFAQQVVDDKSDHEDKRNDEGFEELMEQAQSVLDDLGEVEEEESPADYPQSDYGGMGSQYESEVEDKLSPADEYDEEYFGGMRIAPIATLDREVSHTHSMDTVPDRPRLKSWLYDSKVRRIKDPEAQPSRDELSQRTFCAEVWINGVKALALFDSGCTTDSITPELAYLSKADRIDLTEPVGLQLGTKGSRTKINYGARATLRVQRDIPNHYFDVVDIDKYNILS
ncbi:hypothetical protein FKP32DRAFT_1569610 [Trametes sanguinea]|nr:hypothetical protein FKP32DRAFT_1569610 [Trametes sanguinea]